MIGITRTRSRRAAPLILVGVLPALLLSLGVARFILNHFFVRAPYLLDSGLLSGIAYRSGPLLAPPGIACDYATSFYQVYFSPIISVFSGLSYLVPVGRIEWFAFVQACIYFPIGLAVYSFASRIGPAIAPRRLPVTMLAAFAFTFSGLVLWMIGYPHYEAATPGLICGLLAAVVTDRPRLAWLFLVLAVSVRQDGGLHVALALAPLAYLKWRGVEMAPSMRRILVLIGAGFGATTLAFLCQKVFFTPVDRLRVVYLGSPAYAHLTVGLIAQRARDFLDSCQVIYYPFLATVLLAIVRRDARYLLGWAVTVPWFLFNFTAYDGAKSMFIAYSLAPFLVSVFWVYVYGARLAAANRRLRPITLDGVFALICLSSTLGQYQGMPSPMRLTVRDMALSHDMNRSAVHDFVEVLHTHRAELGQLYVDSAVAAIALEWLDLHNSWRPDPSPPPDTIVFHDWLSGDDRVLLRDLVAHRLDECVHVLETRILMCSREPLPALIFGGLAIERLPAVFAFTRVHRLGVDVGPRGITLHAGASLGGQLGTLSNGTYELYLRVELDPASIAGGMELAQVEILPGASASVVAALPARSREITVQFSVGDDQPVSYVLTSRAPFALTITDARLRRARGVADH